MYCTITDETASGPGRGEPGRRHTDLAIFALATFAVALGPAFAARADSSGAAAPVAPGLKFTATIKSADASRERIQIPLDHSVLVEMSQPVATLQAISPEIAVVQSIGPTQFLISGASYGETQVIAWAADGTQQIFDVSVELELDALIDALKRVDPRAAVTATPVHGSIILTGTVSSARAAERMLDVATLFMPESQATVGGVVQNHLQVAGESQVLLRCTVAEVNRKASRELGINGFMAGDDFRDAFVVNQIGGINPINIGAAADVNVMGTIPFLTGADGIPIAPGTTLSLGFPRVQLQAFLKAMADNSLLRILAEPNLVAVSGETATFLAGGEFPYPVPQGGAAANAITIEFREFGIRLNFTPVVLSDQMVRLRIEPEVSATDFTNAVQISGTVVPGLTQRKTQTTVEIGNGQTIAIAGLLNEEIRGVVNRVPGVGDIPVLGALFRSVQYQRSQTELVVLVTPEIVAPMNPDQVPPVPGQFVREPNDWQLYALGMIEGEPYVDTSMPGDVMQTRPAPRVAPVSSEPQNLSLHGPWGESQYEDIR